MRVSDYLDENLSGNRDSTDLDQIETKLHLDPRPQRAGDIAGKCVEPGAENEETCGAEILEKPFANVYRDEELVDEGHGDGVRFVEECCDDDFRGAVYHDDDEEYYDEELEEDIA